MSDGKYPRCAGPPGPESRLRDLLGITPNALWHRCSAEVSTPLDEQETTPAPFCCMRSAGQSRGRSREPGESAQWHRFSRSLARNENSPREVWLSCRGPAWTAPRRWLDLLTASTSLGVSPGRFTSSRVVVEPPFRRSQAFYCGFRPGSIPGSSTTKQLVRCTNWIIIRSRQHSVLLESCLGLRLFE
jgi:hypothetical protein